MEEENRCRVVSVAVACARAAGARAMTAQAASQTAVTLSHALTRNGSFAFRGNRPGVVLLNGAMVKGKILIFMARRGCLSDSGCAAVFHAVGTDHGFIHRHASKGASKRQFPQKISTRSSVVDADYRGTSFILVVPQASIRRLPHLNLYGPAVFPSSEVGDTAGQVLDSNNFYCTTDNGSSCNDETVFRIAPCAPPTCRSG